MESDNMDYVMHVKYSSFHRQFFQAPTIMPHLNHLEYWLAWRYSHMLSLLIKGRMSATTGQKVVAPSSRQLKLIDNDY